ncbi:MAG: hypothetical protein K0B37_10135 [Bacteroidales bacterium]|nr:hypothetical protein [Bacteroidales bacterium]
MLKKDNWALGIIMGLVVPLIVYGIILTIVRTYGVVDEIRGIYMMKTSTMQLIGVFSNLFTFRYYMVNLKFDKTGRGILLATFIYAGLFFYFNLDF